MAATTKHIFLGLLMLLEFLEFVTSPTGALASLGCLVYAHGLTSSSAILPMQDSGTAIAGLIVVMIAIAAGDPQ